MASKHKVNKLPPFVALTWEMLNSRAYIELTPSASKLLPYFLGKVKTSYNDPERYSAAFAFTFPEAKRYSFATATFFRAYRELQKKGFIEIVEKGGLRGDRKSSNKFKLSKGWETYKPREQKILVTDKHGARRDTTTIINDAMAKYREAFKNGNKNEAEKPATNSKMEMEASEDVFLFPKVKL